MVRPRHPRAVHLHPEKIHPKVLIDDLLRRSAADRKAAEDQIDLFADFNAPTPMEFRIAQAKLGALI